MCIVCLWNVLDLEWWKERYFPSVTIKPSRIYMIYTSAHACMILTRGGSNNLLLPVQHSDEVLYCLTSRNAMVQSCWKLQSSYSEIYKKNVRREVKIRNIISSSRVSNEDYWKKKLSLSQVHMEIIFHHKSYFYCVKVNHFFFLLSFLSFFLTFLLFTLNISS